MDLLQISTNPEYLPFWLSATTTHSRYLIWSMTPRLKLWILLKETTSISPLTIQNRRTPDHEKKQTKQKLTKFFHFQEQDLQVGFQKKPVSYSPMIVTDGNFSLLLRDFIVSQVMPSANSWSFHFQVSNKYTNQQQPNTEFWGTSLLTVTTSKMDHIGLFLLALYCPTISWFAY